MRNCKKFVTEHRKRGCQTGMSSDVIYIWHSSMTPRLDSSREEEEDTRTAVAK